MPKGRFHIIAAALPALIAAALAGCAEPRHMPRGETATQTRAPADVHALVAALPRPSNPPRAPYSDEVSLVEVLKGERLMTLWNHAVPLRQYDVALGDVPYGHKRMSGDERTPEGRYTIDLANPYSAYYLSMRVSYPDARDRAYAEERGFDPGGDIFIHGEGGRPRSGDWTDGCIAISDREMDEVWTLVQVGTPIDIRP